MTLNQAPLSAALAEYNRVIDHAVTLGLEAADFVRCWREGNWEACREFGFEPASWMLEASPAPSPAEGGAQVSVQQGLQVWVIPDGKGGGQFSWEPQDERFWTRLGAVGVKATNV